MTHAHDLLAALHLYMWASLATLAYFCLRAACSLALERWDAHQQRRAGLAPWKAFEAAEHAIEADRDAVLHVVFPRQRGGGL